MRPINTNGLRVGIVGATGMVGRVLLPALESRHFPIAELFPFSSGRSVKTVSFRSKSITAPAINENSLLGCDLVFFVSSDHVSSRLAPRLAAKGIWVIDDSSAFRLDPKVPLVIPEVNAPALSLSCRLIAGPNCTMAPVAVAGYPLHKKIGVREARIASYQAVSGAGQEALEEFIGQTQKLSKEIRISSSCVPVIPSCKSKALPSPIAFNVFPRVGKFDKEGYSSEERKVAAELRKVWGAPALHVSVTAVRVPVIRSHCLAAWLNLRRPVKPQQARCWLSGVSGMKISKPKDYPTPLSCAGRDPVYVGRLRPGAIPTELCLWIVSDNLLKGAALNSIQIAEELLKRGWLKRR